MKHIILIFTVLMSRPLFILCLSLRTRFVVSNSKVPSSATRLFLKRPNKSRSSLSKLSIRITNERKENDLCTNKTQPNKTLLEFDDIMPIIKEDDSKMLSKMIKQGRVSDVDIRKYCDKETSLLTKACELHSLGCVKVLLKNGASVNPYHSNILVSACMKGDTQLINLILKDRMQYDSDSIDFLILHCFSLPEVVCNNKVTTVLLNHITYIDIHSNGDGESLLHYAVEYNRIALVEALLDRGIDREAEDDSGRTPLTLASRYEYIKIVRLLLSYNSSDDNNTTIMPIYSILDALADVVFYRKKFEVVNFFTDEFFLTDYIPDSDIDTLTDALHIAIRYQHAGLTQILINRGVDVNAVYEGRTALSYTTDDNIYFRSPEGDPAVYPGMYRCIYSV